MTCGVRMRSPTGFPSTSSSGGSDFQSKRNSISRTSWAIASPSVRSMPRSSASNAAARYIAPVSRNSRPSRFANRCATVDLPVPAGPSMVTMKEPVADMTNKIAAPALSPQHFNDTTSALSSEPTNSMPQRWAEDQSSSSSNTTAASGSAVSVESCRRAVSSSATMSTSTAFFALFFFSTCSRPMNSRASVLP